MGKRKSVRRVPAQGVLTPLLARIQPADALLVGAIALLAFVVYSRSLFNGYIRGYDDDLYVINNAYVNAGITWSGLVYALTGVCAANWHPLTLLSLMVDTQVFGNAPWGHHALNVLLHAANSALVFILFRRMTGAAWRSAAVAVLFAAHPIHVESVAHIAQRKDVLSAFFGLLALLQYVRYTQTGHRSAYWASLAALVLGLLAKPVLVTLPVAMLALDFWPLARFSSPDAPLSARESIIRLLREKLPMFVALVVFCAVTLAVHSHAGAVDTLTRRPWGLRAQNILVAYTAYLGKILWPTRFAALYPFPSGFPLWQWLGAGGLLCAVSLLALWRRRVQPYLLAGWCWYVVTLIPVIGFVPIGFHAWANRYAYMTTLGIYAALVWWVSDAVARFETFRRAACLAAAGMVAVLAVITWDEVGYWHDAESLWNRAIAVTSDNARAQFQLAAEYSRRAESPDDGYLTKAIAHATEAVRIDPDSDYLIGLGDYLLLARNEKDAEAAFVRAGQTDPEYWKPWFRLGALRIAQERFDDAERFFNSIHALDAEGHVAIGNEYLEKNALDRARAHFEAALQLDARYPGAHYNLARLYERLGQYDAAIASYQEAQRLEPILDLARPIERVRAKKTGAAPKTAS